MFVLKTKRKNNFEVWPIYTKISWREISCYIRMAATSWTDRANHLIALMVGSKVLWLKNVTQEKPRRLMCWAGVVVVN